MMHKSIYRFYNQTIHGENNTPVLSAHALAMLKYYIGDFTITTPETGCLTLTLTTPDDAGYDIGGLGDVLLTAALPTKHTMGESVLLMDALYHINTHDPRWSNAVAALENHCMVDGDYNTRIPDPEAMYISIYVVIELLLNDPDSCITAVDGVSMLGDDKVDDFYMSKQICLFGIGHRNHDMGAQLNKALLDGNTLQAATEIATYVHGIITSITDAEMRDAVYRLVAASMVNNAPDLPDDSYTHRMGNDSDTCDDSTAIDLSKL